MLEKKTYKNGQITHKIEDGTLTYYLKSGLIKATGPYINELFEGMWTFNRIDGSLWQIGNFKNNLRHGKWIRYHKDGYIEKEMLFENDKEIKR